MKPPFSHGFPLVDPWIDPMFIVTKVLAQDKINDTLLENITVALQAETRCGTESEISSRKN